MRHLHNHYLIWRLSPLVLLLSLATAPICVQAQFFFGMPAPGSAPPPVIQIHAHRFSEVLNDGSSWVEGELLAATLVETVPARQRGGFGGGPHHACYYRLQLKIERTVVGCVIAPQTLTLTRIGFGDSGYRVEDYYRPPQAGDHVFVHLTKDKEGAWECDRIGIACDEERKRLDRVFSLLKSADSQQGAQQAIAGCGDADPYFAMWCMTVTCVDEEETSADDQGMYCHIRQHISRDKYHNALIDVLETPETLDVTYIRAAESLKLSRLSSAELRDCHECHCRRIRNDSGQLDDSCELASYRDEIECLFTSVYPKSPPFMQKDALQILAEKSQSPDHKIQGVALLWAANLYSTDEELNAEILRIYREHIPLNQRDDLLESRYWYGLLTYMKKESQQTQLLCDAGLEIIESTLPAASGGDLTQMMSCLTDYADNCRKKKIEWERLSSWLQKLPAFAVTAEQRKKINETLRKLKIEPLVVQGT